MKEIFFRKTGKISRMCNEYMQIEYKDKVFDGFKEGICLEDDVIIIYMWNKTVKIDVNKKDKKWFRILLSD